ncbi:MAG: hypothetical protein AAF558_07225 [Verrucomicrobiota bacterium]
MKPIKFFIALILLPFLWGSLVALKEIILLTAENQVPSQPLLFFLSGFVLWILCYLTLPRPNTLYVLQHEATHAVAIWLSGGKLREFHVGSEGGHVVSDKTSAWISLAPYLVPLYPVIAGLSWAIALWISPKLEAWTHFFLFFWGIIWSFHFCFTISLLKTEQTDFSSQGYLFSWTLIALVNTNILTIVLWAWLRLVPLWKIVDSIVSESWNVFAFLLHKLLIVFDAFNNLGYAL